MIFYDGYFFIKTKPLLAQQFLQNNNFEVVFHPPYSSDFDFPVGFDFPAIFQWVKHTPKEEFSVVME